MNKKYLNAILFGAIAFTAVTFAGCKDYDDDIDSLNNRVDVVEKGLDDLKTDFGQLAYVKGVTYDDATRTLTVTKSDGTTTPYSISDADTKPGTDTNTEYELKAATSGKTTTIKLVIKGTDTVVGDVVTITDTDTQSAEFDPTEMFVKEIEGKDVVCYGDPNGDYKATNVIIPATQGTTIMPITEEIEGETKVIGYTFISKVNEKEKKTIQTTLMINDILPITSFEYIPEKILSGWGERVIVFNKDNYKEIEIKNDQVQLKKVDNKEVIKYLPNTATPHFHVNPASATVAQLVDEGKATILNTKVEKETRAADGVITWQSTKIVDGQPGVFVVTLDADPAGLTAEENELDEIALQFETKEGKVFTTEYVGVINKTNQLNLVLADKDVTKDTPAGDETKTTCHFATSLAAVKAQTALVGADNKATANTDHLVQQILYSDAIKGDFDLAKLVTTCNYKEDETPKHVFYAYKDNDNLELSFESVPYTLENTPQDKYAKLEGNIFTAINYDLTQSKSCIGKAPIVLAKLRDKHNNALMAAAYIKLLIVGDEAAPADDDIYINKDVHVGLGCNTPTHTWSTDDKFMSTEVYTFAHKAEGSNLDQLSKEQFHLIYKLDAAIAEENGKDFTDETAIYTGSTVKFAGKWNIKETVNNEDGKINHEVTFTLTTAPFVAGKTYKAYAVYTKITGETVEDKEALSKVANNNMYPERVIIVYTVAVDDINFTASIKAGNKIGNYWNGDNLDIYCKTPGNEEATIGQDMLTNFEGHKIVFEYSSEFNVEKYPSFAPAKMEYFFRFAKDNETRTVKATDVDGDKYDLFLSNEQTELHAVAEGATKTATNENLVASLSNPANATTSYNELISYAETTVAKALLNRVGRNDVANAFYATLEVVYKNGCDMEVPVTDGKYNAYFIRPVNVEANNEKKFEDGNNAGECVLNLGELVSFTDWRKDAPLNSFTSHPEYYKYYGVTKIALDTNNKVLTNLNRGESEFVDIETIFGEEGAKTLLTFNSKEISYNDKYDFTKVPDFGTVTYVNKDVEVKKAFKLRIPLEITYKWGTIKETITVEVSKTL